jgi:hypothetical protein
LMIQPQPLPLLFVDLNVEERIAMR